MKENLLKPSFVCDQARVHLEELRMFQVQIKGTVDKSPAGMIRINNSYGRIQHHLRMEAEDRVGKYIRNSEEHKLRVYLQKSYAKKILPLLDQEIASLEKFLKSCGGVDEDIKKVFSTFPEKSQMYIKPVDIPDEEYVREWLAESYEVKPIESEKAIWKTDQGEYVRSKSELTIANALYKAGIPYKYEAPLKLDEKHIIYPDFTILNPRTREIIYWEHRGMMDDLEYVAGAVKRIKDYASIGICLGKNLIITEETLKHPLGTSEIERVIQQYLM